ncbi:PTS sugar transporter subunit IIA [Olsenella sp. HMSC062G07]|uniref:PTS sugar transporter subunit IIA n=1 Tax=Olsenella sp. HMSC062G07 TaxID=1739330 RepID=UPI0008A17514|nr:PTS sugar transporter subunit IIA [Olsenella sp. HMSC062G07]OFK23961.1 hypothetical protein HMPREF2826_08915 [Olsenella sp. HMSC062G07]
MLFDKKLARFHIRADSAELAIHAGAQLLLEAGDVKTEFEQHVLKREKQFPTGLDTQPVGVAIPHTSSDYVNNSQIAFVSLEKPVEFHFMADTKRIIRVGMVFLLAMSKDHEHVDTLSTIMELFASEKTISELYACSSSTDLTELFLRHNIS